VVVPLPKAVIAKLKALPILQGKYFFCHGSNHLVSVTDTWQSRLKKVFETAEIKNGGSHRFRHTFATSLLTQGVKFELVSRWLGHASIKVTEKHYSHFLEDRIQAASDVLRDLYANAS
jgi:integrase/recombinase XerD